ncbi:MAG: hypothetical protein M0Z55_02505 [Peptococcaceae bacterium]|nr:hypothetical protein [Peptococcaceae bacterium]
MNRPSIDEYFKTTGFYDLQPMALQIAGNLGYDHREVIEAICKVNDKFNQYPPRKNRVAWFRMVFEEKLQEARADILAYTAKKDYFHRA